MNEYEIGQIVRSKAGRDKGKYFIITEVKNEYIYIVDGYLRRLEKPKLKKKKHIQVTSKVFGEIQKAIKKGLKINNSDIRKAIDLYTDETSKTNS